MIPKKNILFRADGNSEIGLGHVYRCIGIAEQLFGVFNIFFAIKNPTNELKQTISKHAQVVEIPVFATYSHEATYLAQVLIPKLNIQVVTIDGYFFDTEYQKIIKNLPNITLISIDDDQPFHYVSDIVINHAGGINEESYLKEGYTKLFLGDSFLMLRNDFLKYQKEPKSISSIESLLISFGGADSDNYTLKTLRCIIDLVPRITIIIGSSYIYKQELEKIASKYSHISVLYNLESTVLSKLMYETDIAILPSSTISLEAFACKMILITGLTATNQENIYKGLIMKSTVLGIGNFDSLSCESLVEIFDTAKQKFQNIIFQEKEPNSDSILNIYKSII